MSLYDINGKEVPANVSQAAVQSAIISGIASGEIELPTATSSGTLGTAGLTDSWVANAETAYGAMLEKMKELGTSAIPFIAQADPHGQAALPARWMHNKDKRVKNIVLGDVVGDYFNIGQLQSFFNMFNPVANKISVLGNHEFLTRGDEIANYYDLAHYFPSDNRRIYGEQGYFKVEDDEYNVKYLAAVPHYIDHEASGGLYTTIETEQMKWLLNELTANDGYDVVVLMHQLFEDKYYHRDGSLQEWKDAVPVVRAFWQVLKDRRNNRSGSITDGCGVVHNYDFSNCTNRLLCTLHGHSHEELMLTEDRLTSYVVDWLTYYKSCVMGLIDRKNSKLYIWKFNSETMDDVLTLDI